MSQWPRWSEEAEERKRNNSFIFFIFLFNPSETYINKILILKLHKCPRSLDMIKHGAIGKAYGC